MKVISYITMVIIMIANYFGFGAAPYLKKVDKFKVTSYFVANSTVTPDSFHTQDFSIITDMIIFGVANFDAQGNVVTDNEGLEATLESLREVLGDRDIHITLNLLGPGAPEGEYADWYAQSDAQAAQHDLAFASGVLEDNIIAVLNEYDFDGVHFDYEFPITKERWKSFSNFLVSLDKKLGRKTLGIAIADWDCKLTDRAIKCVDTFELMMYDIYDDIGRHSTFETARERSLKIGKYGIPFHRVNFGLPFYARPTDGSAYWFRYNGCYFNLDENGYYHAEEINKDFWFNRPEDITAKTKWAKENGFGGVMIWNYGCDISSAEPESLLRAVNKGIKG